MFSAFKTRLTGASERLALDCDLSAKAFSKDPYVPSGFLIPSTRGPALQFARASIGTYVDSDGLVKLARNNVHSGNNLATLGCTLNSVPSLVPQVGGPLGVYYTAGCTAGAAYHIYRGSGGVFDNPCVAGALVKRGTSRYLKLGISGVSIWDWDTMSWLSNSGCTGLPAVAHPFGDGWYWISAKINTINYYLDVAPSNNTALNFFWTADGTEQVYIAACHRELCLSAPNTFPGYIPTYATAAYAPRFDHDPLTGVCKGLLVEEQRTNLCLQSASLVTAPWGMANVSSIGAATSPAGDATAVTLNVTATSHYVRQAVTVVASTSYVFSFWAKRGTHADPSYSVYNISGAAAILAATSYYAQINSSTWTRVSVVFTTPAGCTSIYIYPLRDSATIGTTHLWGMQLEAGTSATSYIPTTTASVTRSRDTLGVYRENFRRENLLAQSNNVLASPWTFTGSTLYAQVTDPFGGMLGQEVNFSDTVDISSVGVTYPIGAASSFSVYLKKGTSNWLKVTFRTSGGPYVLAWVNFTGSGALGSTVTSLGAFVRPPALESVGNGWFRLSMSAYGFTAGSGTLVSVTYSPVIADLNHTRATGTRFCLYGAQIEHGPDVTAYMQGNLLVQSQSFDNASWSASGTRNVTVVADSADTLAPDGSQSADKCTVGGTTTVYQCVQDVGFVAGQTFTASVYVKGGDFPQFSIWAGNPFTWPVDVIFNLSGAGSVASTTGAVGTITDVGNGWYRCSVTATALVSSITTLRFSPARSGSRTVVGNSADKFYLWGAMLQYGAAGGTYTPTLTAPWAAVNDKLCSTKLTLVCDFDLDTTVGPAAAPIALPTFVGNGLMIYRYSGNSLLGVYHVGVNAGVGNITGNVKAKVALAYDGDSVVGVLNGGSVTAEVGASSLIFNELVIGASRNGAYAMNGHISRVRYFKKRLPGPRLQSLTV